MAALLSEPRAPSASSVYLASMATPRSKRSPCSPLLSRPRSPVATPMISPHSPCTGSPSRPCIRLTSALSARLCRAHRCGAARRNGHRAVVLEQGEETLYPCNSRFSGGTMHLAFLDMGLDPNTLAAGLLAKCPPDLNRPLIEAIGRNSTRACSGSEPLAPRACLRFGSADWQRWCLAPVSAAAARPHLARTGTDAVMRGLERTLLAHGNAIWRGARRGRGATRGRPFRYRPYAGRRAAEISPPIVVLAEGGFQAIGPCRRASRSRA